MNKNIKYSLWFILFCNFIITVFFVWQSYRQNQDLQAFKVMGSRALYAYLVSCTTIAAAVLITHTRKLIRVIGYSFSLVLVSATCGIKFNHFTKPVISEVNYFDGFYHLATPHDVIEGQIVFLNHQEEFQHYLIKAFKKEVVLKIRAYLTYDETVLQEINVGDMNLGIQSPTSFYKITDLNFIQALIDKKPLTVKLRPKLPWTEPFDIRLYIRDYGTVLKSRKDQLLINGQSKPIAKDKALIVSFLFEDHEGNPIIFFH